METERLILRESSPDVIRRVFNDLSDQQLIAYFQLPSEQALAEERLLFKKGYETVSISYRNWAMISKSDRVIVGNMGYHTWHHRHRRAEIGYAMTDEIHKGKGFSSEAMPVILMHGFEKMDLHRVEAFISPTNLPSLRLVQKFGFIREGLLRDHYAGRGKPEDSAVYGLLQPDFS